MDSIPLGTRRPQLHPFYFYEDPPTFPLNDGASYFGLVKSLITYLEHLIKHVKSCYQEEHTMSSVYENVHI